MGRVSLHKSAESALHSAGPKVTVPGLKRRKAGGENQKIAAITAYDFSTARLVDASGVDVILVGDSVATVVQGLKTTLPVTLDEIIYHTRCVSRAVRHALLVADMPFLSYQVSAERAIEAAGRMLKEGGAEAVKLEGGLHIAGTIERLVAVDIPVMGHVGLTPQSYHRMGGHKIQGMRSGEGLEPGTRERVLADAVAVADAGAFALVVEGVPAALAGEITATVQIPTIGIGAGPDCDGQILVVNDMLGMDPDFQPRFVKRYAELGSAAMEAVRRYVQEVRSAVFPGSEHTAVGAGMAPADSGEGSERKSRRGAAS